MSDSVNKQINIITQLQKLGLEQLEATLYIALLDGPATPLNLAQTTGINRTKIYRLAEELEQRGLIGRHTGDHGTSFIATDPAKLEVTIAKAEQVVKRQRDVFDEVLPTLQAIRQGNSPVFSVSSYDGSEGFKQMLWHELKAEGEVLIFGGGAIEELVDDHRWAEKHRLKSLESPYTIREITNHRAAAPKASADQRRRISPSILNLEHQIIIYNNTVATYHWRDQQKAGYEVTSASYTAMMRQVFENFWDLAE